MLTKFLIFGIFFGYSMGADLFSFKDCGGSKMKFHNLTVNPLPIKLSKTEKINVSANIEILEDMPIDALAELKIIRLLNINGQIMNLEIPCIDDIGSCSLKVCDLFSKWYNDVICPFMKKSNVECKCPVKKGVFEANNIPVGVPFSKIKGIIAQLASGRYDIQFRITDPSKKVNYSCLKIHAKLAVE